ncbi:hypothetical protein R3P38DRAFT_3128663 [Favolaschia claudopus]|uniref:Uncharacterized protein n=1 Tax=Favolaschia claudopus TaxID=2862362 RepID=A0AAV9ZAM9_9AGAR
MSWNSHSQRYDQYAQSQQAIPQYPHLQPLSTQHYGQHVPPEQQYQQLPVAAFSPHFRYRDIENLLLPSVRDRSISTATADYTNNEPSISAPVLAQEDLTLISTPLEQFKTLLAQRCLVHEQQLGDCFTPRECEDQWQRIVRHVTLDNYRSEAFVTAYGGHLTTLLDMLLSHITVGMYCAASDPSRQWSQHGDANIILYALTSFLQSQFYFAHTGFSGEWKTSAVFNKHFEELRPFMTLPNTRLQNMSAILKKLGLHINTTQVDMHRHNSQSNANLSGQSLAALSMEPNAYCDYGIVFTGDKLMLVQALRATYDKHHCLVPGLAFQVVPVSEQLTMLQPNVSLLAILLGIFSLPRQDRRDPSRQRPALGSRPPPPPGASPGSGSAHPYRWGASTNTGSGATNLASGSHRSDFWGKLGTVDLYFDLPGIHSPPTSLIPISRDTLVRRDSFSAAPGFMVTANSDSITMSLRLEPYFYYAGELASVFRGQLGADGQPSSHVIVKCYPANNWEHLLQELDAYTTLSHLACVVPTCWGMLAPVTMEWAGLVLEYAGAQLPNVWTPYDK